MHVYSEASNLQFNFSWQNQSHLPTDTTVSRAFDICCSPRTYGHSHGASEYQTFFAKFTVVICQYSFLTTNFPISNDLLCHFHQRACLLGAALFNFLHYWRDLPIQLFKFSNKKFRFGHDWCMVIKKKVSIWEEDRSDWLDYGKNKVNTEFMGIQCWKWNSK